MKRFAVLVVFGLVVRVAGGAGCDRAGFAFAGDGGDGDQDVADGGGV